MISTGVSRRLSDLQNVDAPYVPIRRVCYSRNFPMRLIRSIMLSFLLGTFAVPALIAAASAQIVISVGVPPPPLPDYDQPDIPAAGYMWTPGYWAYDDDFGYYWVPGTWIEPPQQGLLWTPGYWGFDNGNYVYYDGYWGDQVGFYGGVDYGYGYTGAGYEGGYWQSGNFFYNRAVNKIINVNITNVYSKTVTTNTTANRVAYNGGEGGLAVRPTEQQQAFAHQQHVGPTALQRQHVQMAARDPTLREAQNKGRPPIAATSRPTEFKGSGVVTAKTAGARPAGQLAPRGKSGGPSGATPESKGQQPATPMTGEKGQPPSGPKPEERPAATPGEKPGAGENKPVAPEKNSNGNAPGVERKPPTTEPKVEQRREEPKPAAEPQTEERAKPEERKPAAMTARPETQPKPQAEPHPKPAQPGPHPKPPENGDNKAEHP
jgi:hypothetical protein